jgi:hypothetical protein
MVATKRQPACGVLDTVGQRLGAEQLRQRHGDGAHLQHCHVGHGRFKALRHDDGDPVAARHAQARQRGGQSVGLRLQLGIRIISAASARLVLDDSYSFGSIRRLRPAPAAHLRDVEMARHLPAKAGLHGAVVIVWRVARRTLWHGLSPQ